MAQFTVHTCIQYRNILIIGGRNGVCGGGGGGTRGTAPLLKSSYYMYIVPTPFSLGTYIYIYTRIQYNTVRALTNGTKE